MCQSIEWAAGPRFVETIRVERGEACFLPYHHERMNRTRRELLGCADLLDLSGFIDASACAGRTKCRVEYAAEILRVEYAPYRIRPVSSLRVVEAGEVEYAYKRTDRRVLESLFACRAGCDDVLIVRQGWITDTSICNVALWDGSAWITPDRPLLRGTTRARLLDEGLIRVGRIHRQDLGDFSLIRLFNAMIDFGEIELSLQQLDNPNG